jgi:peptidoglycan/LPS O-acetylase OafA/YrhL
MWQGNMNSFYSSIYQPLFNQLDMNSSKSSHLKYLDVLRGWAAIAVCIQHIFGYVLKKYDTSHPLYYGINLIITDSVDWGRFGVVLFFLISGFIIPVSLKPGLPLKYFFISRFFRLYPAYWVTLLLMVIFALYFSDAKYPFTLMQLMANLTMMPKVFGLADMSGVFWTLFIEIVFYLFCAILFKIGRINDPFTFGYLAIWLNLVTAIPILLNEYLSLHIPILYISLHLSFLFAGNLLRLAFINKNYFAKYLSIIFFTVCTASIPISSGLLFNVPAATDKSFVMFHPTPVVLAYVLAIVFFIFAIYFKSLRSPIMVELGKVSYSLYLLHMLCFQIAAIIIPPIDTMNFFIYLILSLILSYATSKTVYHFVEYPSINFGKKIIRNICAEKNRCDLPI